MNLFVIWTKFINSHYLCSNVFMLKSRLWFKIGFLFQSWYLLHYRAGKYLTTERRERTGLLLCTDKPIWSWRQTIVAFSLRSMHEHRVLIQFKNVYLCKSARLSVLQHPACLGPVQLKKHESIPNDDLLSSFCNWIYMILLLNLFDGYLCLIQIKTA